MGIRSQNIMIGVIWTRIAIVQELKVFRFHGMRVCLTEREMIIKGILHNII